jgi:hypothetical protein
VRFTWDPEKSDRNLADRDFDFAFAAAVFSSPTLERIGWRGRATDHFGPSEQSP